MTAKVFAIAISAVVASAAYVWFFGVSESAINAITKPFSRK